MTSLQIPGFDYNKQSVTIPGSKKPGQTAVYRNAFMPNALAERPCPEVNTAFENFQYAVCKFAKRPCLGYRPFDKSTGNFGEYVWETYEQTLVRVNNVGSGLVYINDTVVRNGRKDRYTVGVWSFNKPGFQLAIQANAAHNLITVPLYETLGLDTVEYCMNHAEIQMVLVSADRVAPMLRLAAKIPQLKIIISFDPLEESLDHLRGWASEYNIKVYEFSEIEKLGRENPRKYNPPTPNDLFSISYTSGTTGVPKGAMITHKNIASMIASISTNTPIKTGDVMLSYLPLAHIFGIDVELGALFLGVSIGYYRGDIFGIFDDIKVLKPTYFQSVPRVFNKIAAMLMSYSVDSPGIVGTVARKAIKTKLENFERTGSVTHPIWDRLLLNKFKAFFGGRVKSFSTGGAPLAKDVMGFLRVAFSVSFQEGYGQTETTGLGCATMYGDIQSSHVGPPVVSSELKLVDVPELGYTSEDRPFPRGEICVRGSGVMPGYFKDEEKTKETIDEEGWLHTGDIGLIDARGCVVIIDRKKNIFKLAQGEYIAPERIEQVYLRNLLLSQLYVHGEPIKSYLVGIAVPNPETFVPWACELLGGKYEFEELVKNKKVCDALLESINQVGIKYGLNGFERIKAIHLEPKPFSLEDGIVTATLKTKRSSMAKFYQKIIDQLYENSQNVAAKL
ncbi:7620_t:CDS:2 [Funneliformis mosseae]|uniref:7620_t:CDS:1 n=1 Tax=Funneliformis mosseae TaxID=27381 RepID=A0A9N9CT57_FUNMO|nr:7620_t:CDS:2 [Funneliformis mosseae]